MAAPQTSAPTVEGVRSAIFGDFEDPYKIPDEAKDELLAMAGKGESLRPAVGNHLGGSIEAIMWDKGGGPEKRDAAFRETFPAVKTRKDADELIGSARSYMARRIYAERNYPDLKPEDAEQLAPSDLYSREGADKYIAQVEAEEGDRFRERAAMLPMRDALANAYLKGFGVDTVASASPSRCSSDRASPAVSPCTRLPLRRK